MKLNRLFIEGDERIRGLEREAAGGDPRAIEALRVERRRTDPDQAAWEEDGDFKRMFVALFEGGNESAAWNSIADVHQWLIVKFSGYREWAGPAFDGIESLRGDRRSRYVTGDRIVSMSRTSSLDDIERGYFFGPDTQAMSEKLGMVLQTLGNAVRGHSLQDAVNNGRVDNYVVNGMIPDDLDARNAFPDIIRKRVPRAPDGYWDLVNKNEA